MPLITTSKKIFSFSSKVTDMSSITHVMTFKDLFKSCHMEADKDTAFRYSKMNRAVLRQVKRTEITFGLSPV